MTVLLAVSLTLVALAGAAVVGTSAPDRQAVTLSFFGLTLTVLFLALQAPDVALSQLGVGSAIVPLMVMLAVRVTRSRRRSGADRQSRSSAPGEGKEQAQEPRGGSA